ncbi:helix-turn-helix domain-containing protein [Robertmurraya massiliosenegalensis]|uniref:helix-turn-helix domain-containing protein n=1 Tax=Robertmurraya massiliosenegalensis TaxID=1287657 RepID=UPI0002E7DDDB|nr:helix-turn-helix domain-containing protein [Robertmurraya massiliosenegalensis]
MGNNAGYNLVGQTFEKLTVLKDTGKRDPKKGKIWLCLCECSNKTEASTIHLRSGNKKSCGCLIKERNKQKKLSKSPERKKEILSSPKIQIPKELENIPSAIVENGLFQVFKNGRIFRINKKGKIECKFNKINGYKTVSTTINGQQRYFYVHKLLAKAFIPNPENKRLVIFKDSNKNNLSLKNLQWATSSEALSLLYKKNLTGLEAKGVNCLECGQKTIATDQICPSCKKEKKQEKNRQKTIENRQRTVSLLDDYLHLLTSKQRKIVKLRKTGKSLGEIASILKVSRQAVDSSIKNSKRKVEKLTNKIDSTKQSMDIRTIRKKHGLTQNDMADLLGITISTYSRKEKEISRFTIEEGIKIASLFGETIEDLFSKKR